MKQIRRKTGREIGDRQRDREALAEGEIDERGKYNEDRGRKRKISRKFKAE